MKRKASTNKKREDTKRIAFPIRLFGDDKGSTFSEAPEEIHVVPVGEWNHPAYGEMKITVEDIGEFIENFNKGIRKDLPITAGHDNGMSGGELPAVGWFVGLINRGGNGLYAAVKWTEEGMKLLREGAFKYFSPEFYDVYEDPETRQRYRHVLVGGALTNNPYFKELDAVATFSEPSIINQFNEINSMNLQELLAKDVTSLTDEEKTFIREHASELTDEQKESHKEVLEADEDGSDDGADDGSGSDDGDGDDAGDDAGDEGSDEGSDDGDGEGGDAGGDDGQQNASDKHVMIKASELAALQDKANKGHKAFDALEAMKVDKAVERMVFSQSNPTGHVLPKQKGAVVSFVKSLSEKQREQFTNIVNNMPKVGLFSEVGDGGGNTSDVSKEVETAVQAKIKASENKLAYAEALKEVFAENTDLEKRYTESLEIA
jgi:phage I-like protein